MGAVYRKTFTKPLPGGAEIIVRGGERLARWADTNGKTRTAPLTTGLDGSDRVLITASTYTAKYRDGSGHVREVATGCRTESGARKVLSDLQTRAEKVKSNLITAAEDAVVDHLTTPVSDHFTAYCDYLASKGVTPAHRKLTLSYLRRLANECNFVRLGDTKRDAVESWLAARTSESMSARTRNAYRESAVAFGNWCVQAGRLLTNPFAGLPRANQKADPRRQRRSLTEDELVWLLDAARRRPLLDDAAKTDPAIREQRELVGWERALIYKTLVLSGLRRGELASLTVGQLQLDGPAELTGTSYNCPSRLHQRLHQICTSGVNGGQILTSQRRADRSRTGEMTMP